MTTANSRIQILRGTSAQISGFTPLAGELVFDTDLNKTFVGDGSTVGGFPLGVWNNDLDSGGPTDNIYYDDGNVHIGANTGALETLEVTGNIRVNGQAFSDEFTYAPTGTPLAEVDFDESNSILLDLSGIAVDLTITAFSNGNQGGSYLMKILQGATPIDITWPGSVVWLGNEPTLTDEAFGFNIVTFYYDGTNYIGTGDANIDGGGFT
jgi:hypothetical protein